MERKTGTKTGVGDSARQKGTVFSGGDGPHALATERSADRRAVVFRPKILTLLTSYENHGAGEQIQSQWDSRKVTLSWRAMQHPGGWEGA